MGDPVPAFLEAARALRSALASEQDVGTEQQLARRLRNALARVFLAAARPRVAGRAAVAGCALRVWFAFEQHWGKHPVDVLRPLHPSLAET